MKFFSKIVTMIIDLKTYQLTLHLVLYSPIPEKQKKVFFKGDSNPDDNYVLYERS